MDNFNVLCYSPFSIFLCWPCITFIIRIVKTYNSKCEKLRYLKHIRFWKFCNSFREIEDIPWCVKIIVSEHNYPNCSNIGSVGKYLWFLLSKGLFFLLQFLEKKISRGNYILWQNWGTITKTLRLLCDVKSIELEFSKMRQKWNFSH